MHDFISIDFVTNYYLVVELLKKKKEKYNLFSLDRKSLPYENLLLFSMSFPFLPAFDLKFSFL